MVKEKQRKNFIFKNFIHNIMLFWWIFFLLFLVCSLFLFLDFIFVFYISVFNLLIIFFKNFLNLFSKNICNLIIFQVFRFHYLSFFLNYYFFISIFSVNLFFNFRVKWWTYFIIGHFSKILVLYNTPHLISYKIDYVPQSTN